jgi:hypothetical protein
VRDSTGRRAEPIFVETEHEHEEPFEVGDITFEITACRPQRRQLDGAHRGSSTDSDDHGEVGTASAAIASIAPDDRCVDRRRGMCSRLVTINVDL